MDRGSAITLGVLVTGVALAAALFGRAPKAAAGTRVPSDPAEVLETALTPTNDPRRREEAALRRVLAASPENVPAAIALARLEIELARETSDPRHLGRAQAALAPWWDKEDAPVPILVLRATIAQSLHDFEGALVDLDRALKRDPRDGQAWLTRAVVLTVIARYDEARASCASAAQHAGDVAGVVCDAQISCVTGTARETTERLTALLEANKEAPAAERLWARSVLAECTLRAGNAGAAENHLKTILAEDPEDTYARAAYADLLLDGGRNVDAAQLLRGREANDTLLLRLAIAEHRAKTPFAESRADALGARFDASRARGDVVHRREEARYWLEVRGDPEKALELAKANWEVQREPADARVLLEAARAAGAKKDAQPVLEWLAATKHEDPILARLAKDVAR